MGFRRGDIVWARVVFPKKWWPGLVRSIDGHRVAVSFFDDGEDSRYFLETEVFSFEENFESLVKTLKNSVRGEELLVTALRLLARRAAYSLRCPCHFRPSPPGGKISYRGRRGGESVQPDALLGLILGLAVSPFVGDSDFVGAVTMASQLNVFRRYLVAERKLLLDPKSMRERHSKSTGACSVVQSSDISKLEFESFNEDQPNGGSWVQVNHANTQSLDSMLVNMRCLAFDDNHTKEGCLNIVQQNGMVIINSGCPAIINFEIKKCCQRSSELLLCQPSVKVNGKDGLGNSIPPKPYLSNLTEFLGLKRKYDHPVDSGFRFKLCKTMPLFSINGVHDNQKSKTGRNVCEFEALISMPSFSDLSLKFCNRKPLSFANCTNAVVQRCEENSPDSFSSDLFDKASLETRYLLSSPASSDNYNVCVETNRLESINAAFSFKESCTENKLCLPVVTSDVLSSMPQVAQQSAHSIQREHSTSIDNHKVSTENSRQYSINGPFSSRESCMEYKLLLPLVTSDALSSMPQEAQESANASIQKDSSGDNHNISVKASGQKRISAAFSFKESSTEKNSQVNKQSARTIYGSCQNLYMKFPRDSNIPSKKDLIRKFNRFGQIDLFRTKVSALMGSAQVVFLHHLDAMAAYQYAKRKKSLFGGANVLFWLDPYEKKRSHSRFAAPMPKLKSCLKNPYLRGQEDKKRSRKVRFLMQSQN